MILADGVDGSLHDGGVGAVAGEGQDARLGAGGDQQVVIGQVIIFVAIVKLHGAHGARHDRDGQLMPEEIKGGVRRAVLTDGVHVDAQLLPLLIVADEAGAQTFGAGAGDGVLAGHTVADLAGFAERPDLIAGAIQDLLICHVSFLTFKSPRRA